ncbi:sulfite exporter TauE/SafE family protein [Rhodophyticola porphyridii]|uniref:sulfite exporter TauE/SafE family protein n=1 Tax=Rhodophyticola porphyridii TaxID=1852017 RepID=UPI0035D0ECB7
MEDTLNLMPLWAFVAALAVTFLAGFVKGAVGFALPLIMISGLSLFLEPQLAIAGILLPVVLSNFLQAGRFGLTQIRAVVIEYWRYILIVCIMILFVSQFVTVIPAQVFYLILGVPVMILSLIQLFGVRFHVPPARRRIAEWGIGAFAGGLGGLTGTWGPPTVLYLIALETPKAKQMLVQGVVYGLGSVSLLIGHLQSGVLNTVTAPFSAALLIPAFLGMQVGFWLSDRLDAEVFRKITLIVLVVAGANLVRRGLLG